MTPGSITWDTARAAGMVAYALLTASVAIGLALSLGWKSPRWTRFVTNETHRFLTLVALVFTGIHGVAVAIDPFIRFTLPEVLVPFVSHYRPLWIGIGIVGAYLLAAVYASEWIRPRIGYAWWRRFHTLAFLVYVLATIHGLGSGSDTRTPWAVVVYGGSVAVVGALLVTRLLPRPPAIRRPQFVALSGVVLFAGTLWAWSGPMQVGWNRIANNGNGSGGVVTDAGAVTGSPTPSAFDEAFTGTLSVAQGTGEETLTLDATLSDTPTGSFKLTLAGEGGERIRGGSISLTTGDGLACSGQLTGAGQGGLLFQCDEVSGSGWQVTIQAQTAPDGSIDGTLDAQPQGTSERSGQAAV